MMSKLIVACAMGVAIAPAHGQYVGDVVGVLPDHSTSSSLIVSRGQSFSGAVVLSDPASTQHDFALFRLEFSVEGLEYAPGWFEWSEPYTTGGVDDFSSPAADTSGSITQDTHVDVIAPDAVDVVFENLTDNFGDFFETGSLLNFTLTVPEAFKLGEFTISFVPDTFTAGTAFVDATAGEALTVNVVPAPGAITLLTGLAFLQRRKRIGKKHFALSS